ncbi:hypothetical protein [Maricaulis sp.]|uniref:hypothetical protein n=1 Tax=Maricaulis sp. TaxID=1486257 RepID=UPI003A92249B
MAFPWQSHAGVRLSGGDGQRADADFFAQGQSFWQGSGVHDNPRFYKYIWQIWTAADLRDFEPAHWLDEPSVPQLAFAAAMLQARPLYMTGTVFLIRSDRLYRRGADTPFDPSRIDPARLAPPWTDDADPEFHGHK